MPHITEEILLALRTSRKFVTSKRKASSKAKGHLQGEVAARAIDGEQFKVYWRQSTIIEEAYSAGIIWSAADGTSVTLARYNGSDHAHSNPIERTSFMSDLIAAIDDNLCAFVCAGIKQQQTSKGLRLALPMVGRDGDHITLYALSHAGGYRITDHGSTRMRLSYEMDLSDLEKDARGRVYVQILSDCGVEQDGEGSLYSDVPATKFAEGLFNTAQAVARVLDLPQWNRKRVADTFLDDLDEILRNSTSGQQVDRDFAYADIPSASSYVADFRVAVADERDFLIFGVDGSSKSRLATITLQHLRAVGKDFDSLVVISSLDDLSKPDLSRLLNAANDTVAGVDDRDEITRKVREHLRLA